MIGDNPVADGSGAAAVGIPVVLVRQPTSECHRRSLDLADVIDIVERRVTTL
jgi:ribonucleotide monophosphatase NagD (HAD superfamily)